MPFVLFALLGKFLVRVLVLIIWYYDITLKHKLSIRVLTNSVLGIEGIQLRRNEKKILNAINADKDGRLRFHILGDKGKKKTRIQTREEKIYILSNDCLTGDPSVHDLSLIQVRYGNLYFANILQSITYILVIKWTRCYRTWILYAQMDVELLNAWKIILFTKRITKELWILPF